MLLINRINPLIFLISLFIGIFFCYITTPTPEVIITYPTPENSGKITYKDDADNCYKFKSKHVKCPSDKSLIKKIPVQIVKKQKPKSIYYLIFNKNKKI